MYLDYSKITLDADGLPVQPQLRLQTLAGKNIGTLQGVHDLKFTINFAELSEISFSIPFMSDGIVNPLYKDVVGFKVVYTKNYGVYLLTTPTTSGDGLKETKTVKGYSIEKTFERKRLFLSEGTYNFYDPISPEDTILGRFIETDKTWEVGYVDPALIGRYRTFDEYNDMALPFIYGDVPEKFRCMIVFDPYKNPVTGKRRVNAYSIETDISTVPIYLSYDNLLESTEVSEVSDELVTKLHVYGADTLSIREVNPIGTDYIVNLDHFIQNGDIPKDLAERVDAWQVQIAAKKEYYSGLVGLRASTTAQKIALQAELTDLNGELETLTAQQSITIQAISLETTDAGKATQQELLDQINAQIADKKSEISAKEQEIEAAEATIAEYNADILALNAEISYEAFFTDEERLILDQFMIEDTIAEESFVATDVDTNVSGTVSTITGDVSVSEASIAEIDLLSDYGRMMYAITGGKITIESAELSSDIVRGTLEVKDSEFVCSLYLGACTYRGSSYNSGMLTLSGALYNFVSDIQLIDDGGLQLREGTSLSFSTDNASCFFTVNVSDYQKYSVAKELYDYGQEILAEVAQATYEFTINSANFLFLQEFAPFKDRLEFGKGVHINLRSDGHITAAFIGAELDFNDISSIGLTFSNRFQKVDGRAKLKNMISKSYSSAKSLDASKYIYNHAANKTSEVSNFMKQSFNAAVNTIIGASNLSVLINGAGIQIGGDSKHQMRIVDNMIAITDDGWQTAKLAIGLFASETLGEYFGINADVLAGKLTITNNLIVESVNNQGVTQFRVDATGAWLNNAVFVLQKDGGGKILIDPAYGILAGTKDLFATSGTTVMPAFVDADGNITLDSDGMPTNSNFYLDVNTGEAYFRGKIKSIAGNIGGWTIQDGYLYSGTGSSYVALNASGTNTYSQYAMWAGAANPSSAKFYVKKDGTVAVEGALNAKSLKINGTDALTNDKLKGSILDLKGVSVSNGTNTTFAVDANGNVTVLGNITLGSGSTINWATVTQQNGSLNDAINTANAAKDAVDGITYTINGTTYIDESRIYAGSISADALHLGGNMTVYRSLSSSTIGGYLGYTTSANDGSAGMHMANGDSEVVVTSNGARISYVVLADPLGVSNELSQVYVSGGRIAIDYCGNSVVFDGSSFTSNSEATLGLSGSKWGQIYSTNSVISTSDRTAKKDIDYDLSAYEALFMGLKPCIYRFIAGTSGRKHPGFIAQDIEETLGENGLATTDFAAFIKSPREDGGYDYGLRYEEFVALNTYMIQKLVREVAELREILEEKE